MIRPAFRLTFLPALALLMGVLTTAAPACGSSCRGMDGHGHPAAGQTSAAAITYACPMHPEVVSDMPGRCPKCGMYLEAKAAGKVTYSCPMHSEVVSDKPGKCPKCGMYLEAKAAEKVSAGASSRPPAEGHPN